MEMKTLKAWLTLAGICLLSVLIFYAVPTEYTTQQDFEITGQVQNLSQIPMLLEQQIQKDQSLSSTFHCQSLSNPLQVSCKGSALRRGKANRLSNYLKDDLSHEIGWILPQDLSLKITLQHEHLETSKSEYVNVQSELTSLNSNTKKLETDVSKIKKQNDQLETDLANRKRQLEILQEGSAQNSELSRKALFDQKKLDVQKSISELEGQFIAAQAHLTEISAPLIKRDNFLKRQDELLAEMTTLEKWLATSARLVSHTKESVRVPDPDTFQISALGTAQKPIAHRDWNHIFWSLLIGCLVFFSIRRRKVQVEAPDRVFYSPEEVQNEIGIPHIGTFSLSP